VCRREARKVTLEAGINESVSLIARLLLAQVFLIAGASATYATTGDTGGIRALART